MDIDPHTIQQIIMRVREQLRCPQCRKRVEVEMGSLKVLGNTFAVMQLRCRVCSAHLMLHATLTGGFITLRPEKVVPMSPRGTRNASTELSVDPEEMKKLRKGLKESNGSFMELFGETE